MHTDDINAYYTFKDGEIFLSSIADRITTKKQDRSSPICIANVYPSKHTNRYYECMHPKMSKMFKGIGIKNGVLAIQYFVEDNHFMLMTQVFVFKVKLCIFILLKLMVLIIA
jgi:hypothetical protein